LDRTILTGVIGCDGITGWRLGYADLLGTGLY